jgi:hypothetical protein
VEAVDCNVVQLAALSGRPVDFELVDLGRVAQAKVQASTARRAAEK